MQFLSGHKPSVPVAPFLFILPSKPVRHPCMQSRYEIAREFCVAGRIMFLRPVKHKARVKRKTRRYQPVWISPEVWLYNLLSGFD